MEGLFDSLLKDIQFFVLGALSILLLAYALATWHPLGSLLLNYIKGLGEFWWMRLSGAGSSFEARSIQFMQLAVIVGTLYFLGVAAVVFSYWFVEPVRFAVLECVYETNSQPFAGDCAGHSPSGDQAGEVGVIRALWLPVAGHLFGGQANSNRKYLGDEALVDDQAPKRIHDILDGELEYARLLRATGMFALLAVVISLVKSLTVSLTMWLWGKSDWWYKNLIEEGERWLNEARNKEKNEAKARRQVARERIIYPQLIIFVIAVVLYVGSMISYRTIEFEYSSLVRDAAAQIRHAANTPTSRPQNSALRED
jgi:hypothetical protein